MSASGTGRLVVVSNRVAMPHADQAASGGLAVALRTALGAHGGVWFGWDGRRLAQRPATPRRVERDGVEYVTLSLGSRDYDEYYQGFANRVLWPLVHYRLALLHYRRRYYEGYRRTNAWFAGHLMEFLQPGDTLWVHDYHFVPIAAEVRARGFKGPIGFFLHTPFPPLDILRSMPSHRDWLRNLIAYDLLGFQTDVDRHAFLESVRLDIGAHVNGKGEVRLGGRRIATDAFPIGADVEEIAGQVTSGRKSRQMAAFKSSLEGRRLIIGADRLDYSKGLIERFQAYKHFLEMHPELHARIAYLQVTEPSRSEVPEYQEMRRRLDQVAGEITGEYANFDWMPVRYLSHRMRRATLLAFLSIARVGLVTPLRDGMNLVAKEFVAAQNPEDPGVLVLSEMAGAARQLTDALLVNPYDIEGIGDAIAEALAMPLVERRRHWDALYDAVRRDDIHHWSGRFLEALAKTTESSAEKAR
ncbi:MAG: alpha,alpha-trehalose-phosphate synthase (UDP-forming) [Gammaproteobacteria bacterium]